VAVAAGVAGVAAATIRATDAFAGMAP
jgi:hypothetical protein